MMNKTAKRGKVTVEKRGVQFLGFLGLEVVVKTLFLSFVVTFGIYMLLCLTPQKEELRYSVRSQTAYAEDKVQITVSTGFFSGYFKWLKEVFQGNFGRVLAGQSVSEEIRQKWPVTFILSFSSILVAVLISFFTGLLTTAFKHKLWMKGGTLIIYLLSSLPAFFLGYFLIAILNLDLSFHPSYFLPVITLALSNGIICEMTRIINKELDTELKKNYIKTAKAKGLKEKSFLPLPGTVTWHAFRNALIHILPKLSLKIPFIISGSIVVEKVFSLQGLGDMLIDGLGSKDMNRVLIVIFVTVILVRIGSVMADFLYFLLNPRYGQRESNV